MPVKVCKWKPKIIKQIKTRNVQQRDLKFTVCTTDNELDAWQCPTENFLQLPPEFPKLANVMPEITWPSSHRKCISGGTSLNDFFPLTMLGCHQELRGG